MKWRATIVIVAAAGLLGACEAPLPEYAWTDGGTALQIMRARDSVVTSMMSPAVVTVSDAEGSGTSFDAAVVAAWPDYLRLRAWKFGHPAFDLTYIPEGLFVYIPEEARKRAGDMGTLDVTAEQFRRIWSLVGPGALEGASTDWDNLDAGFFVAERPIDPYTADSGSIEFDIDRRTLTVHRCRFVDAAGMIRQTLRLESHAVVVLPGGASIVWPRRITASGPQGTISIRLRDPEFNVEPPGEAFIPPRRATRQPDGGAGGR